MNSSELYDNYLNACYAAAPEEELAALRELVTPKQYDRVRRKAMASGVVAPSQGPVKKRLPRHIISPSERARSGCTDDMLLAMAGDMLGLFLYGKKFNDGIRGAFGQKQNIRPAAHGHKIVIRLPCNDAKLAIAPCEPRRYSDMLGKITSAMNHYIAARPENLAVIEYV